MPALATAAIALAVVIVLGVMTQRATRPAADAPPAPSLPAVDALDPEGPLAALRAQIAAVIRRAETLARRTEQGEGSRQALARTLAAIEPRLDAHAEQLPVLARGQETLDEGLAHLESRLARIEDARDPEACEQLGQALAALDEQVSGLRAEHQQGFYRLGALEAQVRQQARVLDTLRWRLGPSSAGVPLPDTLPFTVTAIDRWNGVDTVTVAEPELLGRRNTAFLRKGDSHLGWTVTAIDGRRVSFTHRTGRTLIAAVQG